MPKPSVSAIFESFTQSLSSLIKDKVSEAVSKATTEFFERKVGVVQEVKKVVRRKRRKVGSKARKALKPGYSKYGKKLGRPKKRG